MAYKSLVDYEIVKKIMLKKFLLRLAIRLIEADLRETPPQAMTEDQREGMLASLWDNPAFRNYIADRNTKLVYNIAGYAGSEPEPRDKTRLMYGQRVENLVLAAKAKSCAKKRDELREKNKTKEKEKVESEG